MLPVQKVQRNFLFEIIVSTLFDLLDHGCVRLCVCGWVRERERGREGERERGREGEREREREGERERGREGERERGREGEGSARPFASAFLNCSLCSSIAYWFLVASSILP
jgi:hypothetical protein